MWYYYRQNLFFNSTPEGNSENFLVNFCEIFKNIYFVEYLQRVLLPIAPSAVESVLTFIIPIWQLCKIKNKWINNKLLLNFLQLVRQLDVMDLTSFLVTLCAYSPLLASSLFFDFWSKAYLAWSILPGGFLGFVMLVTSAATVTILCFACVSGLGRARGGGWGVSGGIRGGIRIFAI